MSVSGYSGCPFMNGGQWSGTASLNVNASLPPGHPPLPHKPLRTFTLEQLRMVGSSSTTSDAAHDGRPSGGLSTVPCSASSDATANAQSSGISQAPCLVAVKGVVYDVTTDGRFGPNGPWESAVGRDLTRSLAFTPIRAEQQIDAEMQRYPLHLDAAYQGSSALVGLEFDELRSVETWSQFFQQHYPVIGRLLTDHEVAAAARTTNTSGDNPTEHQHSALYLPGEEHLEPLPSDIYGSFLPWQVGSTQTSANTSQSHEAEPITPTSIHAIMDTDDETKCVEYIRTLPSGSLLLESECFRSSMRPLHRAIEYGWIDAVRALVDAGADVHAPCKLYDNDAALSLARRFNFIDAVELLEQRGGGMAQAC